MNKLKILLTNLNNSESIENKMDIDKLKGVPVDLKKYRSAIEKYAVKKQCMIS